MKNRTATLGATLEQAKDGPKQVSATIAIPPEPSVICFLAVLLELEFFADRSSPWVLLMRPA